MNTANGNLVLIGMHTATPQVFWNGQAVQGVKAVKVNNDTLVSKVQIIIQGDAVTTEMAAAGIEIKVGK